MLNDAAAFWEQFRADQLHRPRDGGAQRRVQPSPWTDSEWMSGPFWLGYPARRDALSRDVAAALDRLTLPPADASYLLRTVTSYCRLLVEDHEQFERSVNNRLAFYMAYYAQPINLLLRRA